MRSQYSLCGWPITITCCRLRLPPFATLKEASTVAPTLASPDGSRVTLSEGQLNAPDGVTYDPARNRLLITEDAAPGRMVELDGHWPSWSDIGHAERDVIELGFHRRLR